jgi:hypothetical protein
MIKVCEKVKSNKHLGMKRVYHLSYEQKARNSVSLIFIHHKVNYGETYNK